MITKYDMTSGEQIYQTGQSETKAADPVADGLVSTTPRLQLIEAEIQPKPTKMPPDMATCSIQGFLRRHR